MTRDVARTVTPKLRFPEFGTDGPWKALRVSKLLSVRNDKRLPSNELPLFSLTIEDGVTPKSDRYNREFLVRDQKAKSYKLVLPGDIVYNPSNLRWGAINRSYVDHSVVVSPIYEVLYPSDADSLDQSFISTALMRPQQIARFISKGQGTLIERIAVKIDDFLDTGIEIPSSLNEQKKIADCVASLDEVIAAQSRKVKFLKAHKRGLMQQLFPREGETLPHFRLPEFRDTPEWEEMPLDACFSHIRNGFVGTATPFYVDGGIPYLQGKNVKKGQIDPTGLVTISKAFHDRQKKSQLQRNDIVMVQSGHVGECAFIDDAFAGVNCHALIIMTPKKRQHSPFFVHCFGSDYGMRLIGKITTGNTIEHILASDIKALVVRTPQFAEQQRIADCLSSLDAQIAAESEKLAALRTHKRGLMQQLFPPPEEIEA